MTNAEEVLIAAYREAAVRIERELRTVTNSRQRRVILRRIDLILNQLDQLTAEYVQRELPLRFTDGSAEAIAQLQALRGFSGVIDEKFTELHKEAIQQLADDATVRFATSLEAVKRESRGVLSRALRQQIIGDLISSELVGEANPAERVKEILQSEGIVAVRSANRRLTLENYVETLTRTTLADAHNAGAASRFASNGVKYGRVIEKNSAPDVTCRFMRNKIVFIGDRRLLPPYHPNCMGGIAPVIGTPNNPIMSPDDPRIPAEAKKLMTRR